MMKNTKEVKVLLFGSYSGYNKGDLAILTSLIKHIFNNEKDCTLFVPSKKPDIIKKMLPNIEHCNVVPFKTITAYWGFSTLRVIKKVDLLIYGGGGLFFDKKAYNVFINHVINLFVLTVVNDLFFKKPIYGIFLGASHLKSTIMILMTKYIIKHTSFITARDFYTSNLFSQLCNKNIEVSFDPAFLLKGMECNKINKFINLLKKRKKIIIVLNETLIERLIAQSRLDELVKIINNIQNKYQVVLTYNTNKNKYINKIYSLCNKNSLFLFHPRESKPEEIIYLYSKFDYVICAPMHAGIFAYNANVKLITIEYNNKIKEFNKIIGNKNSVSVNNLKKIEWHLDNYYNIEWEKRSSILINVSRNMSNIKELISDIKDKKQ